jgi:hypothetical protein
MPPYSLSSSPSERKIAPHHATHATASTVVFVVVDCFDRRFIATDSTAIDSKVQAES